MHSAKTKAELLQHKSKLANSYSELLREFSSKDLRHVGNYTVGKLIGKGSFGKVYLARHNLTNGSKVVLKASSKDDPNLAREIHHHRQFIHPHIARLYEVIITENLVWLVLEFCPGDELYNYLVRSGPLPVEKVQKIFTQLVGAVAYIHSKQCVHRDLKLENVLLDKNENVKLCDFGFTREYEGKASYLQTFCGTVCYSAPEMLKGEKYAGEKVDVWSLGIILYALLRGELPFDEDDDQATKAKILKDEPVYPDTFPDAAKSLLSRLLSKRPFPRPSLAEILLDPFLAEHAPHQQAVLKLTQPAPFTTALEKATLERIKSAGVDIDRVIENVLSQRCDSLAGWWALLMEKEIKKEARRERKRKEAEMKIIRRLSAASSRLDRMGSTLEEVAEEGPRPDPSAPPVGRDRSTSRGRTNRRSTPQIMITDLPQLPEGSAVDSPGALTPPIPPTPIQKDPARSYSGSRPPLPPKERRRRSSNLQLMSSNLEHHTSTNGVVKRQSGRKKDNKMLNQLAALKHWFIESTKRGKSSNKKNNTTDSGNSTAHPHANIKINVPSRPSINGQGSGHARQISGNSAGTRGSYTATLTPITSNMSTGASGTPMMGRENRKSRSSLSPTPITPRSSYRRSSNGLRGRKSTSSSVSSVRSLPRHTHSKASSVSSTSLDTVNSPGLHSPGTRSVGRSPHTSIKVLPATPTLSHFSAGRGSRTSDHSLGESSETEHHSGPNVMFARRKKPLFKGPNLNSSGFAHNSHTGSGPGSPAFFGAGGGGVRQRETSDGRVNLALRDALQRHNVPAERRPRKSQVIEEEEEDEHEGIMEEDDEEEIEEVEAFPPVDLRHGERVHSIVIWDDPPENDPQRMSHDNDETRKSHDERYSEDNPPYLADIPIPNLSLGGSSEPLKPKDKSSAGTTLGI